MKKSIIFSILVGTAMLIACDPIEDRDTMTGAITADQLKISATPVIKDGVKSNYIELNSEGNACLTSWDYGYGAPLTTTKGIVKVMMAGDNEIVYNGMNADGTITKKTLIVHVEKLFDVEPEWSVFCGDKGTKTWVWDDALACPWGKGPYLTTSNEPGWWGCDLAEIEKQAVGKGYPADGKDGSMVFSLKGARITKTDGTFGTFSFKMDKKTYFDDKTTIWSIGKLYTKGINVLLGVLPDSKPANQVINEYDITKLDANHLYLACTEAADAKAWGACWFWRFKAK